MGCLRISYMRRALLVFGLAAAGCGYQVPEHDVVVTSDCRGAVQASLFHFEAMDFAGGCGAGFSGCGWTAGEGRYVSGDLIAESFILTGTAELGPMRYELEMVPPGHDAGEYELFDPNNRLTWCGWYVDADLKPEDGARRTCYASEPCFAELDVRL